MQFSGFFREYSLDLKSDFGDGLIRQSEFRTVRGGNASYEQTVNSSISFSAGMDLRQDSPRNAELARADASGTFQPVTLNNFAISDIAPYVSIHGPLSRWFSYNVGVRSDEVLFSNLDRITPADSYQAHSVQTSPRATFSFHAPGKTAIPIVSFSYGEAFHTNDPRIGVGPSRGTPIATSRAYQLLASAICSRHTVSRDPEPNHQLAGVGQDRSRYWPTAERRAIPGESSDGLGPSPFLFRLVSGHVRARASEGPAHWPGRPRSASADLGCFRYDPPIASPLESFGRI